MGKNRLEAFSDGVIAIIITIMVLELKVPHEASLDALKPIVPVFFSYVLSFVNIGIYWNNHHHLLHAMHRVNGSILWANLHLLFWLSLVPFTTAWMGENHFAAMPTAVYAFDLLLAAISYYVLQGRIIKAEGPQSVIARAVGADWKGKLSPVIYIVSIPVAFLSATVAQLLIVAVAIIWLVPDPRIERAIPLEHRE